MWVGAPSSYGAPRAYFVRRADEGAERVSQLAGTMLYRARTASIGSLITDQ